MFRRELDHKAANCRARIKGGQPRKPLTRGPPEENYERKSTQGDVLTARKESRAGERGKGTKKDQGRGSIREGPFEKTVPERIKKITGSVCSKGAMRKNP